MIIQDVFGLKILPSSISPALLHLTPHIHKLICTYCVVIVLIFKTFTFTKMSFFSQLAERPSSQDLMRVVYSIFQPGGPSSFSQLISTVSDLFCGYPEGEGTRVFSFNWYEDNNYKAFLGINSSRGHESYIYDKTASESC